MTWDSNDCLSIGVEYRKKRPKPPLPLNRSTITVRRHFHRHPAMAWLGGRWQRSSVRHGREVGLFTPAWTHFLKNTALISGVRSGFLRCCHTYPLLTAKPRSLKTPIVSLARLLYASPTFLAERWQVSPGNRFPTKAAQRYELCVAFLLNCLHEQCGHYIWGLD